MVLSALLEFPASALTYVGNYAGPCYIHLNGEAILVRYETGEVINKWPYNCIRQFRAEDETGKFSFVSGRRGPYGVAEYNFKMPNESLNLLQSALTNFTGAQFSSVAPGSGSGSGTDQSQQPLPQQPQAPPPPHKQSYSVSSAYQTTTSKQQFAGGRTESISSSYADVFTSPSHHTHPAPLPVPNVSSSPIVPPRLPPRDYSTTSLPSNSSNSELPNHVYTQSMDETLLRSQMKERSLTGSSNASTLSTNSTDAGTPPNLPPRRNVLEKSPERARVAQSSSYNEVKVQQQKGIGKLTKSASADVMNVSPSVPGKKLFDRLREAANGSSASLPAPLTEVEVTEDEDQPDKPIFVRSSGPSESESSLDTVTRTRTQLEQDKLSKPAKESPYDHLPGEKTGAENAPATETVDSERNLDRPCSASPEMNLPDFPDDAKGQVDEEGELGLYRSSPTVKTRSITPENAKKIRRMAEEGQHRRTLTTSRVSSEGRVKDRDQSIHDQRRVQTMKARPTKARPALHMQDSNDTYQVPRPARSSSDELDGHHLTAGSDSSPKISQKMPLSGSSKDIYQVPRSLEPQPDRDDVYKVPSNIQALQVNGHGHGHDTYSVPRKQEDMLGSSSNYDSPRQLHSTSPPRFSRSASGKENEKRESRNISEEMPPKVGRLRPTRSFESLHRMRVNTTAVDSSPRSNNRPVGVYMDIDLDRPIPPAKNAPLPPLPQLPGSVAAPPVKKIISESLYCEISDKQLEENRRQKKDVDIYPQRLPPLHKPRSMSTHGDLSGSYPRYRLSDSGGLAKAKELSEEQGYEYFGPAGDSRVALDRSSVEGGHSRQGSYPSETRVKDSLMQHSTSAGSILESKKTQSVIGIEAIGELNDLDLEVLGSSIPTGSELTDEYIIVTGADRRPKINLNNAKMPAQPTAPKLPDDEYEVMTSARAENIIQRQMQRVQYPTHSPAPNTSSSSTYEYSTPNPSLYSVPPSNAPSYSTVALPSQTAPKDQVSRVPLKSIEVYQSAMAGINMEDMSPLDDQPTYGNVVRKSSSLSTSSVQSDGNEDANGSGMESGSGCNGAPPSEGVAAVGNTELVKTMAGSPLNSVDSNQLKNQAQSLGNILEGEENHYQVPPSRTRSKSPPTNTSSPPSSPLLQDHALARKHHDYVNHMIEDNSRPSTPENKNSPSLKQKRPQPLPRSARGESLTDSNQSN